MYFHSVLSESRWYLPISDSQKWPPGTFLCPFASYFHYPSALTFYLLFLPPVSLSAMSSPPFHIPLTFHHCSFFPPGRSRLQQCWEYDRVRPLCWSFGVGPKYALPRAAAACDIPVLSLRIRTAGRIKITRLQKFPPAAAAQAPGLVWKYKIGYTVPASFWCIILGSVSME